MLGLPGFSRGNAYREQELHTQLGLDEQQQALRDQELERTGGLSSHNHVFVEAGLLVASAVAIVVVIFLALELLT